MKHVSTNTLKKMTKAELIERILNLQKSIERLEEHMDECYTDDQLNERYDQGYDAGMHAALNENEELSEEELKEFGDNVLRFG